MQRPFQRGPLSNLIDLLSNYLDDTIERQWMPTGVFRKYPEICENKLGQLVNKVYLCPFAKFPTIKY